MDHLLFHIPIVTGKYAEGGNTTRTIDGYPVVEVPVFLNPNVNYGKTDYWPLTIRVDLLNERVLLHEILHALLARDPKQTVPVDDDKNELLVQHLTAGLLIAGYRRTEDQCDLPEPENDNVNNGSYGVVKRNGIDTVIPDWR